MLSDDPRALFLSHDILVCALGFTTDGTTRSMNDGGPDVSLVTGRIRMLGHSSGVDEEIDGTKTNAIMKRNNDTTLAINSAGNICHVIRVIIQ